MFKESTALFLYAETSLHAGSGESLGAIDLAIQRERYTSFPYVAAQGIKGPIRAWFEQETQRTGTTITLEDVLAAFGPDTKNASEHAGAVAFTDARILLFPVRSLKGIFAWITCPFALGRLRRDLGLAGNNGAVSWHLPEVVNNQAIGSNTTHACKTDTRPPKALLDEEVFTYSTNDQVGKIATWLCNHAFPNPSTNEYDFWRENLEKHLLVLHDDDFRHFVKTATEVQARIKLGPRKTTTEDGNLFYQENLPPETLLYSVVLAARSMRNGVDKEAEEMLRFVSDVLDGHRLQIGGDETTGKGYVFAQFLRNEETVQNGNGELETQTVEATR